MPTIFVFNEFTAYDMLCKYVDCPINKSDTPILKTNDVPDTLFQTNIKIFFNSKDAVDIEHAYRIKQTLEDHSFATFVTDQLTSKEKNGDNTRIILLPKDRIIMKLNT